MEVPLTEHAEIEFHKQKTCLKGYKYFSKYLYKQIHICSQKQNPIQSNVQNKFFFSKNANFKNIILENIFLLLLKIFKSSETLVLKYHIISDQKFSRNSNFRISYPLLILDYMQIARHIKSNIIF